MGFIERDFARVQALTGRVADEEGEGVGLALVQGVAAAGGQAARGHESEGWGEPGGYAAGIDQLGKRGGCLNCAAAS